MKINSNKKYVLFKVLLVIMMLNILPKTKAVTQTWCWTISMANEPTYVFDPSKGGINWGFCEKVSDAIATIGYDIEVETSSLAKSGTDSALNIQIMGHNGMTQEKVLGSSFEAGTVRKFTIDDADVGMITKIQIKIAGTNGYRCRNIKITKGTSSMNFQCLKRLEPCTNSSNQFICQMDLLPEGDTAYEITVKSNDEEDSGCSSPILIGVIGEKGISNIQMLSESGIEAGNQITSVVKVNDVGAVTGYQCELTESGKWKGSYMIIKTIKNGQVNQFDLKDVALVNPGTSSVKYDSSPSGFNVNPTNLSDSNANPKGSIAQYVSITENYQVNTRGSIGKTTGGFNKGFEFAANAVFDGFADEDSDNNYIKFFTQYNNDSESAGRPETDFTGSSSATGDANGINVNNCNGGLILPQEKKKIIDLDCTQKLINPSNANLIFGPEYPTSNASYMKILARCPANCHKTQGQVYGSGIHPENSPICLSALVDRAISEYGGIFQISIFPGFEKYLINKTQKHDLIKVTPFIGHSKKSYVLTKVDNVDLVEKDIRILDASGNLATAGRLEVRLNAKWGTVCTLRNNEESARRICKDLGFREGKWLTQAGQVSCQNYNGQNFCGSENYKSIFSDINCSVQDESFNACSKKEANKNECPHLNDAIISCSNVSFESANSTSNGTLRLENVKINNGFTIGRLEYYNFSKYMPVCSNGFTLESANVACRQMGFISGNKYDDFALKFTYPADDPTAFAATQVKCNGDEANLANCNSQTVNIECSHVLDVVVQCVGPKGDPTGKSQTKSAQDINIPPALGKLSMLKFKINCDTKGIDSKFRGDAGSAYLVVCPANCKKEKGSLWGLGLYSLDSSVCQAGVHSGIINDEKGGTFAYTKIWGQNYYIGNTRNGISSSELNSGFPVSFTVQALNSGWTGMWKLWKENYGGVYLEEGLDVKENEVQESKFLMQANLQKSKNLRNKFSSRKNILLNKSKINNEERNNNVSSFVELSSSFGSKGNFTPVFEWVEIDASHVFSDKESGSVFIKESTMRSLKKYQVLIRAKMTDFKGKKSFIFSNGGCNNFNIFLDETDNLVFGDPCSEAAQINVNFQLALNDKTIIYAYYEDSVLKVVIFSEKLNKPIYKSFSKTLEIQNNSAVGIGRKSDVNDMFFYGYIDFIQIYDEEIPFAVINQVIDSINNKAKVPSPNEVRNTLDKRSCISSCVNDPTPGQPGCPTPPKDADPYAQLETNYVPLPGVDINISGGSNASFWAQHNRLKIQGSQFTNGIQGGNSSFEGGSLLTQKAIYGIDTTSSSSLSGFQSIQNQVTGNASPSGIIQGTNSVGISGGSSSSCTYSETYIATYGTYDSSEQNNIESMTIDCETSLKDHRFSGNAGRIFRVKCPSCKTVKRPVYGSFIYHPLSSICKAAGHAGTINPGFSGYVIVELVSGKKIYNGSFGADGNISGTFSSSEISYKTKAGTPPMKITCADAPNMAPFNSASIGSKFVVICPTKCSLSKVSIYGSEIYSDMSPICHSGIHYGVLSDKGGEIEFLIEGSQSYFKGTRSFGIISKSRDAYVRSFRFVGVKSAIFYKFKEDCRTNFNSKWLISASDQVINKESNSWGYQEYKTFDTTLNKYVLQNTIHHGGIIKSTDDNNYGVYITLKNVEWNNGRVQTNFLFKDSKMAVFLFRYQDKDNYYAMEIDISNLHNNLKLVAKVDGSMKIIESKFFSLNFDTWYRMTLIMNNDKISISIQTDKIREIKPVFEHNLELLSRGTIGFASNGNNDFYISGIEVDDFVSHSSKKVDIKNRRSWINLLKHTEPKAVKNYCMNLFRGDSTESARCLVPQNYCKLKCDDHIPTVENILNFNCYKDCLNKIGYEKNEVKTEAKPWAPKVGEKIDFSAGNDGMYVPGNVLSLQEVDEFKKKVLNLTVSYNDNAGNSLKTKAKFPSGEVKNCGTKLTRRKDC